MLNLKNRIAALEARYRPLEQKPVYCFPVQEGHPLALGTPLADGVFNSRYGDFIEYETRAQLDAWIAASPDQSFIIVTQEQYDKMSAELDAEC